MKSIQKPGPQGLGRPAQGRDRRQLLGEAAAFGALAILLAVALVMILPLG